jgi:inosine-uridine nucleoside N-ribohydrolase
MPPLQTPRSVPRTFLIDTDTASDYAVARIMAFRSPDVHVAAITSGPARLGLEHCG